MEACTWILLAVGLAATALYLSWRSPRPALLAAAAWAAVPWLSSDLVSNVSAARLFAWASSPDRVGGLSALVVMEALVGGWEAVRRSGSAADGGRGFRDRLVRSVARAAAWAPSPSLAAGLVGVQASLFHAASGWSFTALNTGLSAAVFFAIVGGASAWRFARHEPERRAAGSLPFFAILFALGATLSPVLDSRPKGVRAAEIDLRATAFLLIVATTGLALGIGLRLIRVWRIRKGAAAS
ncbi:hypothetical protein [Paludisphaera rhizosphaerae]|uniref:hypothetical protein n=1 Tax=Paludisphaera rhizosphaerae TaxID=2711216 RepID=UPI0013EA6920|nr:hypothetical protein [Paludisphaera rhizosphaerae]